MLFRSGERLSLLGSRIYVRSGRDSLAGVGRVGRTLTLMVGAEAILSTPKCYQLSGNRLILLEPDVIIMKSRLRAKSATKLDLNYVSTES